MDNRLYSHVGAREPLRPHLLVLRHVRRVSGRLRVRRCHRRRVAVCAGWVCVPIGVSRMAEGLELRVRAHLVSRPVADSARGMAPGTCRLGATVGGV